jgi:hypothetical protein
MRKYLIDAPTGHDVAAQKTSHCFPLWRLSKRQFRGPGHDRDIISAGPKAVQRFRCSSLCILELRFRQTRREECEYGVGDLVGVDPRIAVQAIVNSLQERAPALHRDASVRMPTLVVETAQQRRQLRAEIDRLVPRQRVPQSMQCREQSLTDPLSITPCEPLHQRIDPLLGRLERLIEVLHPVTSDLLRQKRSILAARPVCALSKINLPIWSSEPGIRP